MKYLHKALRKGEKKFLGLRPTKRRWFLFLVLTHFLLGILIWETAQMVTHQQAMQELKSSQAQLRNEIRSIAKFTVELEMDYLKSKKLGSQ